MKVASTSEPATRPINNRAPVPEFPISKILLIPDKEPIPLPKTSHLLLDNLLIDTPIFLSALAVARTSSLSKRLLTIILPVTAEPIIKDLCDIDLSPGTIISPDKFELLCDIIEFNLI